jgi:hypothetical protein
MLGFPEVVKGIPCFQLAPRNQKRLDQVPNFPALAWKLAQKNPRVGNVDVITPQPLKSSIASAYFGDLRCL